MDIEYLLVLQQLRDQVPDAVNTFFFYVSELAGGMLPVFIVAVIFWCVDKRAGYFVTLGYAGSSFLNQTIKNIACVYRPWILDARVAPLPEALPDATGYSFPSGHTSSIAGFCGAVAIWFRKRKVVVAAMIVFILLVGFSRNWLGCHTPQDVLVGLLVSAIFLTGSVLVVRYLEKHPEKDVMLCVGACVVAFVALLFISLRSYPLDYVEGVLLVDPWEMQTDCFKITGAFVGFCVAWIIERRFIHFENATSMKARVFRFVFGCVVLGAAYGLLSVVLSTLDAHAHKFIEYFMLTIAVIVVVPACIKALEKRLPL
ncbi:MAG: phosphatase PAP2 family protein [Anaerotardibacter sp.]